MEIELERKLPPWKLTRPKRKSGSSVKLSAEDKAAARERARHAGRRYPNLIDNMWAAQRSKGLR